MQSGQLISGQFLLQRILAESSTGTRWRALEISVGRLVQIHFVPDSVTADDNAMKRLRRHWFALQKWTHPLIVPSEHLMESSEHGAFFVSHFVEGLNLEEYAASWIRAEGLFPFHLIFEVLRPVASALDEAMKQHLVHRSLTPRQIIINQTKGIQIHGFELPGVIRECLPQERAFDADSLRYLAPEQFLSKKTSAQSDQYSFAMIVAELLANRILYPSGNLETFRIQLLTGTPLMLQNYPNHINASLQRALHHDPTVRFSSCLHFLDSLAGLVPSAFPAADSRLFPNPSENSTISETKNSTLKIVPVTKYETVEEKIVSYRTIISVAKSATAKKIASKIRKERRQQCLFYFGKLLILLGIFLAIFLFWNLF
jgi:serine/threonine protein kinase